MRHPLLKIMQSNVLASLALAFATALPSSALAQGSLEFGPLSVDCWTLPSVLSASSRVAGDESGVDVIRHLLPIHRSQ
jgi:hypothetical protein